MLALSLPLITFDAPTIMALVALVTVVSNTFLTWDARRRGIATGDTMTNVVIPKLTELHDLTNGQSKALNAVSKALGHAEGAAEEKAKANDAPQK